MPQVVGLGPEQIHQYAENYKIPFSGRGNNTPVFKQRYPEWFNSKLQQEVAAQQQHYVVLTDACKGAAMRPVRQLKRAVGDAALLNFVMSTVVGKAVPKQALRAVLSSPSAATPGPTPLMFKDLNPQQQLLVVDTTLLSAYPWATTAAADEDVLELPETPENLDVVAGEEFDRQVEEYQQEAHIMGNLAAASAAAQANRQQASGALAYWGPLSSSPKQSTAAVQIEEVHEEPEDMQVCCYAQLLLYGTGRVCLLLSTIMGIPGRMQRPWCHNYTHRVTTVVKDALKVSFLLLQHIQVQVHGFLISCFMLLLTLAGG